MLRSKRPLLISICLLTAFTLSGSTAYTAQTSPMVASLDPRPITLDEYMDYIQVRYLEIKAKSPNLPTHQEVLQNFARDRILASSEEASSEAFLQSPEIRWRDWAIVVAESNSSIEDHIRSQIPTPTEGELRAEYERMLPSLTKPGSFSFHNLFFEITGTNDAQRIEAARKKVEAALATLGARASGDGPLPLKDFLEIASDLTKKPTSEFVLRGPFPLGKIHPALEKAVLGTPPGCLTGIVQTTQGFQIARTEERELPGAPSFEVARDRVEEAFRARHFRELKTDFDRQYLAADRIVFNSDALEFFPDQIETASPALLIAQAGSFKMTVGDFANYMQGTGRLMYPPDLEEKAEIHKAFKENLTMWVLTPALRHQAAEALGLTQSATYTYRLSLVREAVHGYEVYRRALRRRVDRLGEATDEEADSYYASHMDEFKSEPKYRVREILVEPEKTSNPVEGEMAIRDAESLALAAVAEIKQGGLEDFVIEKYSDGEESNSGGLTDWLLANSRYPDSVWDQVTRMEKGEWMDFPARIVDKVVILKLEDIQPGEQLPLEDVRESIRGKLKVERVDALFVEYVEELLKKANYRPNEDLIATLPSVASIVGVKQ